MQNRPSTQKFILKLFPEIMVKGSSAKRQMVGQLYTNLLAMFERVDTNITTRKYSDKIEVFAPSESVDTVRELLCNTSGIEQILEALQFDDMDTLDKIKAQVGAIALNSLHGKSFVVRVKRSGKHPFNSVTIEQTVGGYLLEKSQDSRVDLKNAQITIRLELINNQLNIINKAYKGLSGFPIGTQGDILSLMSGGFDSTVASYLTMKRGIKTHFIFFNLGGIAHEIGVKQVALYLWQKFGSSHRVKFITVNFEAVVDEIFRSTAPTYMGVTLKRLMLIAAEKVADSMQIDALLTGESVAQVSSQTLRNLALIDQVTNKLVLRPLSTMNKPEIIQIANDIGTRHFAESMPEYCGVISQNPITHGSFKRMQREADKFDYTVLDRSVEEAQTIYVDTIVDDVNQLAPIEIVTQLDKGSVIIDIRNDEAMLESAYKTIKIPFNKLKMEFEKLPQDQVYYFYCDKGVLSQLHAQYLRDAKGFTNIKVYRP